MTRITGLVKPPKVGCQEECLPGPPATAASVGIAGARCLCYSWSSGGEVSEMTEDGRPAEDGQWPPESQQRVTYRRDAFIEFVREMYRRYPHEWVAIAVDEENLVAGETKGRIIGHSTLEGVVFARVFAYRQRWPDAVVNLFTTSMVAPALGER